MRRRGVLEVEGRRSLRTERPAGPSETAPETDFVRMLLRAVQRPDGSLHPALGPRTRRPLDTQYWACWIVTAVFPVLVAYLWFTR